MTVKIIIPTPLRQFAGDQKDVFVDATDVGEALSALIDAFVDLKRHLYSEDGKLRPFINVYLGDEDVRYLQQDQTPLQDGAILRLIPSVAGGCNVSHPDK